MIGILQNGWIYGLELRSAAGIYALFVLSLLAPCLFGYLCGSLCARFLPMKRGSGVLPYLLNALIFLLVLTVCAPFVGFQYVAAMSVNPILYATALCIMLGQIFPAFQHFKGTDTGLFALAASLLLLCPLVLGILLVCFGLILLATRYTALSAVISALMFPLMLNGVFRFFFSSTPNSTVTLIAILMGLLITLTHRHRLAAIMRGEEPRVKLQRKPKE